MSTSPTKAKTAPSPGSKTAPIPSNTAFRETVESVVIAFILAFLFRTFEAEAFVIPTGSMAPTLQGRHKCVACPKCHYEYRTGVSDEVLARDARETKYVFCPQCQFGNLVDPMQPAKRSQATSYSGDRIIVGKFAYELSDPKRWDVFVFHCPDKAEQNFIKRLVGLPNETLMIQGGDLYTQPHGKTGFEIPLRSHDKLLAMLQNVYDNDFQSSELAEAGWPVRWQNWSSGESLWKDSEGGRVFAVDLGDRQSAELRYQHFTPNFNDWNLDSGAFQPRTPAVPKLITDQYAYNTVIKDGGLNDPDPSQNHFWVGDLALSADLDVQSGTGEVELELIKGGVPHRCTVQLSDGTLRLSIPNLPDYTPTAKTKIVGPGKHSLMLANCDHKLYVWVDNTSVTFDAPTEFNAKELNTLDPVTKTQEYEASDLAPAGVRVRGAKLTVSHLRLLRDVFYLPISRRQMEGQGMPDITTANRKGIQFDLQDQQYFALGDNSPNSSDSRLWLGGYAVDRKLIIGKAIFIYWPSTKFYIPLPVGIDIPFWPNWSRMKFVR